METNCAKMVTLLLVLAAVSLAKSNGQGTFCVVDRDAVVGSYSELSFAKARLQSVGGRWGQSRMICEIENGKAKADPHRVGGEHQGAGQSAGFNKFWWDWNDIRRMNQICDNSSACTNASTTTAFCVVDQNAVVATFNAMELAAAKARLRKISGSWGHSRMICEMYGTKAKANPHWVGGENQGSAMAAGFNKWWLNWPDIRRMNAICEANPQCKSGDTEASTFCVVDQNVVVGSYSQLSFAKARLKSVAGGDGHSRMVCEMRKGKAKADPHWVGGQNQGLAMATGFNKFWRNWPDIRRMNAICNTTSSCVHTDVTTAFCVVDHNSVVATFGATELAEAKTRLNHIQGGSGHSRMICEMYGAKAKANPHWVGGENQGVAMQAGFNKWWWNWRDIRRMNAICEADRHCARGEVATVEGGTTLSTPSGARGLSATSVVIFVAIVSVLV